MAHRDSGGLGRIIYNEWLIPIVDYYCILNRPIKVYELLIPFLISSSCTAIYYFTNNISQAISKLSEVLPDVIAILIGFTFTFITLILTSSGPSIEKIKKKETDKVLHNKKVTLFQELHIQFTHSLFTEVILMLLIFLYLYISPLVSCIFLDAAFLFIDVMLLLNILLSILRGITNLYFSFYNN